MKPYETFASHFGGKIKFNQEFIVEKSQRYYFLNPQLKRIMKNDFYYSGLYLGKIKKGIFFPSFNLLNLLVSVAVNKVVIDSKSSWLFICGRDVFGSGIVKFMGSRLKGDFVLVLNELGECLGFGRIVSNFEVPAHKVVIKNVLDVGDFLRRENVKH